VIVSMSTRAVSGASSHLAKQKVVKLLFGRKYAGKGPQFHRQLDHSIYSYRQLKSAYLKEIHKLHPDKNSLCHVKEKESAKGRFVTLKNAWSQYEELARMTKKVQKGDETDANFTMFAVGCSFADNDSERALREKITDQACRGWFSAGALGNGEPEEAEESVSDQWNSTSFVKEKVSLCDDDIFIPHDDPRDHEVEEEDVKRPKKPRNFLVRNLIHPHRRKEGEK